MTFIESFIAETNNLLWSYVLIGVLIALGTYFTVRSGFVQFKMIKHMFQLLGDGIGQSSKEKKGVSSFQAFCMSTASRVGIGNLAGVATAIAVGGPGAVFWMWVIALLGAASSFIESTLAQIYKVKDGDTFRGGPAYYMEKALNQRWLGIIFSILITISFGLIFNSVQSNTIAAAFDSAFGIDRLTIGLVMAGALSIVMFGGVKRVAKMAELIVPVMAVIYLGVAAFVIVTNFTEIPSIFLLIIQNAFGFQEVAGGTVGAALMMGIKRGLFSNEAGMGSAPNAAATASVTHPVKQGLLQALGVFVDTLLVCSATAFIILCSGVYTEGTGLNGVELTQASLASEIGAWAPAFIAIAILLFAFSSLVGNYYYGETNIQFIHGNKAILFFYRVAVIGMVIFGAVAQVQIVWDLADFFMGFMALINLYAITRLSKFAFMALKDYNEQRKAGKDPVFYADTIEGLENTECWTREDHETEEKTA